MAERKHLLVLEDSPMFVSVLRFILRDLYDVDAAPDGDHGWELLRSRPYDLLLTDCQMPKMDGLTLCKLIRSRGEFCRLPIIVVTAKAFEFDVGALEHALEPCHVIMKPFNPKRLLAAIEQALASEATALRPASAVRL